MGLLTGKTALITGAARGIGKAVAMKFAQEGANIAFTDLVLNDDMAAGLEATRKEIEALGVTCRAYAGNAADFAETEKTVKQIHADFGSISSSSKCFLTFSTIQMLRKKAALRLPFLTTVSFIMLRWVYISSMILS